MSSIARMEYFQRISSMIYCIEKQNEYNSFLNDQAPIEVSHNSQASLIRNGLSISNFCYFEDFIKTRLGECIQEIPQIFSNFNELPQLLQELITYRAIESIHKRSETVKRSDDMTSAIQFIQEHTAHIGSTFQNTPYTTSPFSIGWAKENLNFDDFVNYLKLFHVNNIPEVIKRISSIISHPMLDPKLQFIQIASSRHKAAHVASFTIPTQNLYDIIKNTITFAFIFDYCITYSMKLFSQRESTHLSKSFKFHIELPHFRYVQESNHSLYKSFYKNSSRSSKNFHNYTDAESFSISRLKSNEFYISKSINAAFIKKWELNF